jgi:protein O-mannosyl-transferase
MKKATIPVLLLLIITAAVFSPSLRNGFTNWDDNILVTENNGIKTLNWHNTAEIFSTTYGNLYHPLVLMSYSLEYLLFKLNPAAYHFTNLTLHLLNILLVFMLIYLMTENTPVSFISALLFGIHPLQVEPVAWVSGRKDLLFAFFFLAALACYSIYLKKDNSPRYYIFSLLFFVFSLLSKAMAVTLPLVLLLFDYGYRRKPGKRMLAEKLPFFAVALCFSFITVKAYRGNMDPAGHGSLLSAAGIVCYGLIFYLVKTAAPFKLSCNYASMEYVRNLLPLNYVLAPLLLSFSGLIVFLSLKRTRKLFWGGFFFLATILPVINLLPGSRLLPADRYFYIPGIGVFYLFAEGFYRLYSAQWKYGKQARILLSASLAFLICSLSMLSHERCRVWKDSVTLWNDALKKNPDDYCAHLNIAQAYLTLQNYPGAVEEYGKALEIRPKTFQLYESIGLAYFLNNDYENALAGLKEALRLNPDSLKAHLILSRLYRDRKEYAKAITECEKVLELDSGSADARFELSRLYFSVKEYDRAIDGFTEVLKLDPGYHAALYNLGIACYYKKDYERSLKAFEALLKADPENKDAESRIRTLKHILGKQ